MRCSFLLVAWHAACGLSAIFVRDYWSRELDVFLNARSYRQLTRRTTPGQESYKPVKPSKPGLVTVPENRNQEINGRYSSPRPDRGRQAGPTRPTSPSLADLTSSAQGFLKYGFPRSVSPSRGRPSPGNPDFESSPTRTGYSSKHGGGAKYDRTVNHRKTAIQPAMEAHSLVSGTGYAFSSSKHKYGGLSSQSTVENTMQPVMRSAKDHDWVKAGGVTRKADSKAAAVATGSRVTGKLGRAEQSRGAGSIEFRAGRAFQQVHKVGPGEKIERTLNAGDILDSTNIPFKQATVTTHLTGPGNCLAGACTTAQYDATEEEAN